MKERQNTKYNHRDFDLQDRFINIDSTFNQAFPCYFKETDELIAILFKSDRYWREKAEAIAVFFLP